MQMGSAKLSHSTHVPTRSVSVIKEISHAQLRWQSQYLIAELEAHLPGLT